MTAAIDSAVAGGIEAYVSVTVDALNPANACPLRVTLAMPELRTPTDSMYREYAPHRMPKFCFRCVRVSDTCGTSVRVSAVYRYLIPPRVGV